MDGYDDDDDHDDGLGDLFIDSDDNDDDDDDDHDTSLVDDDDDDDTLADALADALAFSPPRDFGLEPESQPDSRPGSVAVEKGLVVFDFGRAGVGRNGRAYTAGKMARSNQSVRVPVGFRAKRVRSETMTMMMMMMMMIRSLRRRIEQSKTRI